MTVRCSSPTMAPIWIWSPPWLSKGTSWRVFSRMTRGETDSRKYPQKQTDAHSLLTFKTTLTIWGKVMRLFAPSLSLFLSFCLCLTHTHTHTHTHIISEFLHSYKNGKNHKLLDFLEAQVHGKYEALWKAGQMCPFLPQLQLVSHCVFTIIDILIFFVTKFHSSQTCQLSVTALLRSIFSRLNLHFPLLLVSQKETHRHVENGELPQWAKDLPQTKAVNQLYPVTPFLLMVWTISALNKYCVFSVWNSTSGLHTVVCFIIIRLFGIILKTSKNEKCKIDYNISAWVVIIC